MPLIAAPSMIPPSSCTVEAMIEMSLFGIQGPQGTLHSKQSASLNRGKGVNDILLRSIHGLTTAIEISVEWFKRSGRLFVLGEAVTLYFYIYLTYTKYS